MKYQTITLEKKENIATITLNQPEKLNVLTPQMGKELEDAFGVVDRDAGVRVVVLTGAGRAFSAGADIGGWFLPMAQERRKGAVADVIRSFIETLPLALTRVKKPVIASINGAAVGFGGTVTLPCDIRIASEEAKFSFGFTQVGISPEMGSSYFLPRLVGIGKACELILTAKMINAEEAREIGLVNQVVPAGELTKATYEMAASIAKLAPLATQISKRALYQGMDADIASQLQYEVFAINHLFGTEDFEESCKAFLEKRAPIFKGR